MASDASQGAAEHAPAPRTGREVHLVARPVGTPVLTDFAVVEVPVPAPGAGEILVQNDWISLDPSTRIRMRADATGYMPALSLNAPIQSLAIGRVVASRHERFALGDPVLHAGGWSDYVTFDGDAGGFGAPAVVDARDVEDERAYLGPLGYPGLTSYVGLMDVAHLSPGETVFVSGAAGAVGGLAVQIARLNGATVIGSAGTAAKVEHVRRRLGADAAFCYRGADVETELRRLAPDGIDVYFDNVGGDHLRAALEVLRPAGRVALCGAISTYGATERAPGPDNLFNAVAKGLTLRGFLARMFVDRMPEFRVAMRAWLASGKVIYPETIIPGLGNAPEGFIQMLTGGTRGKTIVRVAD